MIVMGCPFISSNRPGAYDKSFPPYVNLAGTLATVKYLQSTITYSFTAFPNFAFDKWTLKGQRSRVITCHHSFSTPHMYYILIACSVPDRN